MKTNEIKIPNRLKRVLIRLVDNTVTSKSTKSELDEAKEFNTELKEIIKGLEKSLKFPDKKKNMKIISADHVRVVVDLTLRNKTYILKRIDMFDIVKNNYDALFTNYDSPYIAKTLKVTSEIVFSTSKLMPVSKYAWILYENLDTPVNHAFFRNNGNMTSASDLLDNERKIKKILKDVIHGLIFLSYDNIMYLDLSPNDIMGNRIDGEDYQFKIFNSGNTIKLGKVDETTAVKIHRHNVYSVLKLLERLIGMIPNPSINLMEFLGYVKHEDSRYGIINVHDILNHPYITDNKHVNLQYKITVPPIRRMFVGK